MMNQNDRYLKREIKKRMDEYIDYISIDDLATLEKTLIKQANIISAHEIINHINNKYGLEILPTEQNLLFKEPNLIELNITRTTIIENNIPTEKVLCTLTIGTAGMFVGEPVINIELQNVSITKSKQIYKQIQDFIKPYLNQDDLPTIIFEKDYLTIYHTHDDLYYTSMNPDKLPKDKLILLTNESIASFKKSKEQKHKDMVSDLQKFLNTIQPKPKPFKKVVWLKSPFFHVEQTGIDKFSVNGNTNTISKDELLDEISMRLRNFNGQIKTKNSDKQITELKDLQNRIKYGCDK